ncbi:3-methyladenine DNA glycosylase AlkD [Marinoscillum furvescens DSM 4134]|uniref:3-methyladenine DNA glycosylase AlkD n=2 Tax=Marinoscillum furvescens TaxID=1026 RepID=A0A3D9L3K5_MARFU|nr:3-methyladenine DNA glycosylase AlkD [Marinoscillum furvescens DSM 4134]
MSKTATASDFIASLEVHAGERSPEDVLKHYHGGDPAVSAMGIAFGKVFALARKYKTLGLEEINNLLDSHYYEVRMGAVSIMDFQARNKATSSEHRKKLFDLYLSRHNRLDNWDFVDRGAMHIVGKFLLDKPRDPLYQLAKSNVPWERRTAIVATHAFIKMGQLEDTFAIARMLVGDGHEFVQKAVGSWVREAGKQNEDMLRYFLDEHVGQMARVTLRYAVEKLDAASKKHYLTIGK